MKVGKDSCSLQTQKNNDPMSDLFLFFGIGENRRMYLSIYCKSFVDTALYAVFMFPLI